MTIPQIESVTDTSSLAQELETTHGLAPVSWQDLNLNRNGSSLEHSQLLTRGVPIPHVGFEWQSGDANTADWMPQGITGLRQGEEKKFVVVSWYFKGDPPRKGVRLSFVDVTDIPSSRGTAVSYRHVLLVQPSTTGDFNVFRPIPIHAGGLASRGNIIFVMDTNNGVRAFDTSKMFPAQEDSGKSRCGIIDNKAFAFDYRYILPQTTFYHMTIGGQNFSYSSLDWSDMDNPLLLIGNYHSEADTDYINPPPKMVWWNLDGTTITGYDRTVVTCLARAQGGMSYKESSNKRLVWLSRSGSDPTLSVGRVSGEGCIEWHNFSWPRGCEDLHFSPYSHNIWCLTEHRDRNGRFVFAVKKDRYTF
jgi:hypothetical protein